MAPLAVPALVERRAEVRNAIGDTTWDAHAILRPGVSVRLLNISTHSALLESSRWLRPGTRTELQLSAGPVRTSVPARLDRCYVVGIEPMRYRGVLIFDNPLTIVELAATG